MRNVPSSVNGIMKVADTPDIYNNNKVIQNVKRVKDAQSHYQQNYPTVANSVTELSMGGPPSLEPPNLEKVKVPRQ